MTIILRKPLNITKFSPCLYINNKVKRKKYPRLRDYYFTAQKAQKSPINKKITNKPPPKKQTPRVLLQTTKRFLLPVNTHQQKAKTRSTLYCLLDNNPPRKSICTIWPVSRRGFSSSSSACAAEAPRIELTRYFLHH